MRCDLVHETVPRSKNHPTVPAFDGLTDSPGTELAYRLPTSQSPGWRLLAKTIFVLLWNGLACVLIVWVVAEPGWFLACFLIPYLGVSGWTIYYLLQQIWIHTGLGQTAVEISDHPLLPGREYQVHLSQAGHIDVKSIELWLVCEEEVTYRQGTDIRHEICKVFEQQLVTQGPVEIDSATPFRCHLHAPHSRRRHAFVPVGAQLRPLEAGGPLCPRPLAGVRAPLSHCRLPGGSDPAGRGDARTDGASHPRPA